MDGTWEPALTVGGLRGILDQFPGDMHVVTTGLDEVGFAYFWAGKYNDIRVEWSVVFAPTGVCDKDRPQALGVDLACGIDVPAIGDWRTLRRLLPATATKPARQKSTNR